MQLSSKTNVQTMLQLETYMWINNYMYYHSPPGRKGKLPEGVGHAGKSHDPAGSPCDCGLHSGPKFKRERFCRMYFPSYYH